MSRRTSIVKALAEKFKVIDGTGTFKTNIFNNSEARLKFWDECTDFPSVFTVAGSETRQYLPADFTWGFLAVSIKIYTKGEDSQQLLEELLEDVESVIHDNRNLVYDTTTGETTTEILVSTITTDEGLLFPYSVGEMNLQVRYIIQ